MYRLRWYCWAILNGGRFGDLHTIYQGYRVLPFALAGLSCYLGHIKQESQSNAKVSMRQPWYIGCNSLNRPPLRIIQQYQRNLYTVEMYFQCATIPSLTMRVYRHSFSRCCLSKCEVAQNSEKIWFEFVAFKVIQGYRFWCQSKAHMQLPISPS